VAFTGKYNHTIDSKGRLIFPSRLRDELEENQAMLMPSPDPCIEVWSGEAWKDYEAKLIGQSKSDPSKRSVVRELFSAAHADKVDGQGRITITQELRDHAGITKDVVIVGSGDHAEIWDPERLADSQGQVRATGLSNLFEGLDI
jgi:MraZ protein